MTIDDIQNVVEEFTKRLQLPESKYTFSVANSNDFVELIITVEEITKCSLSISNGSIKVLYTDEYNSQDYTSLNFLTPITLLYYLCTFFFVITKDVSTLSFNELLSVVLLEDVDDWQTLTYALAENLNLSCEIKDGVVDIEGTTIRYIPFLHKIILTDIEIPLEDDEYTTLVNAIFKCVEYIANIIGVADDFLAIDAEEDNVEEGAMPEDEENMPPMGGGGDMDIDMDIDMPEGGEAEAVEPVETETFEEPQGPVVTMDDLI